MKLDSRIIEGKRPLTCIDAEQAREFEGKKCFMASGLSYFNDLSRFEFEDIKPFNASVGKLLVIDDLTDHVFYNAGTKLAYRYVLPCEWVEQKSKITFEPYTLDTWEQDFKPGDTVVFRDKEDATEYKFVYSGYIKHPNNLISVSFGPYLYTFYDLFNSYEIYRNGNWEPFGKETKEGE